MKICNLKQFVTKWPIYDNKIPNINLLTFESCVLIRSHKLWVDKLKFSIFHSNMKESQLKRIIIW